MDLIFIRRRLNGSIDSGYLQNYSGTFDVTTDTEFVTNNFEIETVLPDDPEHLLWSENGVASMVFVEGAEYGGLIEGSIIDVEQNTITYTGRTWRGHLDQWIIEPPPGQDYRTVSGNIATILRSLPMGPYIEVEDTSYSTGSFSFDRYVTTFSGVAKLLANVSADLRTSIAFQSDGTSGSALLSVTAARDLRNIVEVSQDYNNQISLKITRDGNTPKHLICLGSGELHEREVIHLYADDDWTISQTPIVGAHPVEVYDFSSSENLLDDGMKHYQELIHNHEQIEVNINDLDIRLGDIIGAKDILTGEEVSAEITSIIWRVENFGDYQTEAYEYKTKVLL